LNEFKNRAEYVEGDFRFRHKNKQNPRRLIKLWAEKELLNLKKMLSRGIPCPTPIALKENILVMSFIGTGGWPAPRMKEAVASMSNHQLCDCYQEVIRLMRVIYQKCKLVHADLSEYNLLYHEGSVWVIDVSQSVEYDHPKALDFLRKDCNTISTFFGKHGVAVCMKPRDLFDFVTDIRINDDGVESYLDQVHEKIQQRQSSADIEDNAEKIRDAVFANAFIPRNLHDVKRPWDEIAEKGENFYHAVTGLNNYLPQTESDLPQRSTPSPPLDDDDEDDDDDDDNDDDEEDDDADE